MRQRTEVALRARLSGVQRVGQRNRAAAREDIRHGHDDRATLGYASPPVGGGGAECRSRYRLGPVGGGKPQCCVDRYGRGTRLLVGGPEHGLPEAF
jgi:hypothetical protein